MQCANDQITSNKQKNLHFWVKKSLQEQKNSDEGNTSPTHWVAYPKPAESNCGYKQHPIKVS